MSIKFNIKKLALAMIPLALMLLLTAVAGSADAVHCGEGYKAAFVEGGGTNVCD